MQFTIISQQKVCIDYIFLLFLTIKKKSFLQTTNKYQGGEGEVKRFTRIIKIITIEKEENKGRSKIKEDP